VSTTSNSSELRRAVDEVALWYHSIDLPDGSVTPGWFDLRPIVEKMPWPDVKGKRCLDVGTYDGYLAFQLERRGAAEVVATDISAHEEWDWPARSRAQGGEHLARLAGPKGRGFEVAGELLGSSVQRREISVYDLHPDQVGTFDVVVCGSLMLHLRDPIRALEAIRSVCTGVFLSAEEVRLGLSVVHRGAPVATISGHRDLCQWWLPTVAGHRHMVHVAGFRVDRTARPYSIPVGPAHPPRPRTRRALAQRAIERVVAGGTGVPHSALLATPEI
jgi:tRNA (mo5U34)-methyltransferase